MELLVKAQGVDAGEVLCTHARNRSTMKDAQTVLRNDWISKDDLGHSRQGLRIAARCAPSESLAQN